MPEKYQVKLTGPGLAVDKEVSEELANRLAMLVLSDGKAEPHLSTGGGAGSGPVVSATKIAAGNTSVREVLLASDASKIPQQMTVIGHYILEKLKKENFSLAELVNGFNDAKESEPKNPYRDIASAIKRGWIASGREKDSYYITSTGMKAIESHFPKEARKRKAKKGKTTSAKNK